MSKAWVANTLVAIFMEPVQIYGYSVMKVVGLTGGGIGGVPTASASAQCDSLAQVTVETQPSTNTCLIGSHKYYADCLDQGKNREVAWHHQHSKARGFTG